jgi:RNA polymerase sigma factor (sigma-70 family)
MKIKLNELTVQQTTILSMYLGHEMTQAEIAARLNITQQAVSKHIKKMGIKRKKNTTRARTVTYDPKRHYNFKKQF